MRSIQEVGSEILNNIPDKFYVFTGSEYGVKRKYIEILSNFYKGSVIEADSVVDILTMMSTKRIIPLVPSLYVVRYDANFLSYLDSNTSDKIRKCNIIGTIVCLYETCRDETKLDKYLPNYTVSIGSVSSKFVFKYLKSDFPSIPDRLVEFSAKYCDNYSHAYNVCKSMSYGDISELYKLSDSELCKLYGISALTSEDQLREGIASRNFKYLIKVIENVEIDLDTCIYTILSTLIELEKIYGQKHVDSPIAEYSDRWTLKDIYNMFMHTYYALKKLRTISSDPYSILLYLFALLQFSEIPSVEVMS